MAGHTVERIPRNVKQPRGSIRGGDRDVGQLPGEIVGGEVKHADGFDGEQRLGDLAREAVAREEQGREVPRRAEIGGERAIDRGVAEVEHGERGREVRAEPGRDPAGEREPGGVEELERGEAAQPVDREGRRAAREAGACSSAA